MKRAYAKYIMALLLFGSNGVVAASIALASYEIVWIRTLLGSVGLLLVFVLTGGRFQFWRHKKHMGFLLLSGAAMGLSWIFLFEAYDQIGVGVATLAYYVGPALVILLAPLLFRERLTPAGLLGFVVVLLGMFLIHKDTLLAGGFSWGLVCGLLAAVMYAFMVIFNKKATGIAGLENAVCQMAISFLTVSVYLLFRQGFSLSLPEGSVWPLLWLGLINTGLGCYLYFAPLRHLPARSVAVCGYLEPLSALLFSALFLRERLAAVQWVGAALMLGGAVFAEWWTWRRRGQNEAAAPAKSVTAVGD